MYYHQLHNFYNPGITFSDFIQALANIITIVGVLSLWLAWTQYRNQEKEKRKAELNEKLHLINAVKNQLVVIGHWTGYGGNGYPNDAKVIEDWKKNSFKERANPFLWVNKIDSVPLQRISLLPATKYFSDDINYAIANLNLWLTNFDSILLEIRAFKFSHDPQKNILLSKKLQNNEPLDNEEAAFADILVNLQVALHFQVIADDKEQKLHYWHKKLLELIIDFEKDTKRLRDSLI